MADALYATTPSLAISPAHRAAAAATVAADLLAVGELAQGLSLVAKNARTLVAGAGDRARGLGVIAEHFSDLADTIIALTKGISDVAIELSKQSVVGWRRDNTCGLLALAKVAAKGAQHASTLDGPIAQAEVHRDMCHVDLRQIIKSMNFQLSELHDCMRTSEVISVTFLLEASQTGENEASLVAMASKIDSISKAIRERLNTSRTLL